MNTDNEATRLDFTKELSSENLIADPEATELEESYEETTDESEPQADKKSSVWHKAAIGAGAALVVGAVSTVTLGMMAQENAAIADPDEKPEEPGTEPSHPEWSDGKIAVATGVDDGMTFNQAFAAARAEVGPGGCFEWHGNIYGTYTAQEWNSMSAAERAEWNDHFSWNHIDTSTSTMAHHSTGHNGGGSTPAAQTDDIDVVSVTHNGNNPGSYEGPINNELASNQNTTQGHEIEVYSVRHDTDNDANVAEITIDGDDAILVDVNNDLTFDVLIADSNHNGYVENNEVHDISGQDITVADLGGFTSSPTDDFYATGDSMDMPDDAVYEA